MELTPDSHRYLQMADGVRQPLPFHWRWALPKLCGRTWRWAWVNLTSLVFVGVGTVFLATERGLSIWEAHFAAVLVVLLPAARFLYEHPVLCDAPGLAMPPGSRWRSGRLWWPRFRFRRRWV